MHSLAPATMADPSTPLKWSDADSDVERRGGTNTFPWITAGSDGRVDVAWYHTDDDERRRRVRRGHLTNAEWSVQLGQSLEPTRTTPAYSIAPRQRAPVKYGQICTNGLGCATGGDRSLGDFLQVRSTAPARPWSPTSTTRRPTPPPARTPGRT